MAKTIEFNYDGQDYTLEFTRRTIEQMEREGFKPTDLRDKSVTALPQFFAGAFKAHHRGIKSSLVDEIFSQMPDKQELMDALAEMYNQPLEELMSEPDEKSKNVEWVKSW